MFNIQYLKRFFKSSLLGVGGLLLFITILLVISATAHAQRTKLPPFRIVQENNTVFKAGQLPQGKPVVLIYFLPDCEHCHVVITNLLKHINEFDKASVVMVTYYPPAEVGKFARKYGFDKRSNFYLGTEGNSFIIKNYYNLSKLPFMALYTKNGDLVKAYYSEEGFNDLLQQLKPVIKRKR
ncbi:MAG: redoxin domain-containing protein [Chitinophagaceae bacterium]|jgi:hypothetical protein|nr:redoxin domain-containing protein [Chitinophagaceae bacterium]